MHTEHSECIVSVYCRESQLLGRFAGTNILPPPAPPGVPRLLLRLLEASWFNADWQICSLCMRLLFIHLFIDLLRYFLPNQTSGGERCTFEPPPTAVPPPSFRQCVNNGRVCLSLHLHLTPPAPLRLHQLPPSLASSFSFPPLSPPHLFIPAHPSLFSPERHVASR